MTCYMLVIDVFSSTEQKAKLGFVCRRSVRLFVCLTVRLFLHLHLLLQNRLTNLQLDKKHRNVVLLFCSFKEKNKLQIRILNKNTFNIKKKNKQKTHKIVTNNENTLAHTHKLSHQVNIDLTNIRTTDTN